MATIKPQTELLKQAVAWVSEKIKEKSSPLGQLLNDAGMRFNLGPKDQDFLKKFFSENPPQ